MKTSTVPTISELLCRQGLNSLSAADRAGLSRVSIWRWTNGISLPRNEQLGKLAGVLGISIDEAIEILAVARERAARRRQRRSAQLRKSSTASTRQRRQSRSKTPAKGAT